MRIFTVSFCLELDFFAKLKSRPVSSRQKAVSTHKSEAQNSKYQIFKPQTHLKP